jgi:hypothetical protein
MHEPYLQVCHDASLGCPVALAGGWDTSAQLGSLRGGRLLSLQAAWLPTLKEPLARQAAMDQPSEAEKVSLKPRGMVT